MSSELNGQIILNSLGNVQQQSDLCNIVPETGRRNPDLSKPGQNKEPK